MNKSILLGAAAFAAVAAMPAFAQSSMVYAVTDLNVRAGPGPQYPVIGVLPIDADANLNGCLDTGGWCSITHAGGEGWVASQYLAADYSGSRIIITERPAEYEVPVVTHDGSGAGVIAGGTTGAITGAIVGGPVGAVVGGVAGAATGGILEGANEPPVEVRRYIETNPVDPVYLEGEVVVGATLPDTVVYRDIPDYQYQYVYVNGQPVLVEPQSRRIVYIVR